MRDMAKIMTFICIIMITFPTHIAYAADTSNYEMNTTDGKYIYYTYNGNSIYSTDMNMRNPQKLYEDIAVEIKGSKDGYVFFNTYDDPLWGYGTPAGFYVLNAEKGIIKNLADFACNLYINDDCIYYYTEYNGAYGGLPLYYANLDGSNKKTISEDALGFTAVDNKLYYDEVLKIGPPSERIIIAQKDGSDPEVIYQQNKMLNVSYLNAETLIIDEHAQETGEDTKYKYDVNTKTMSVLNYDPAESHRKYIMCNNGVEYYEIQGQGIYAGDRLICNIEGVADNLVNICDGKIYCIEDNNLKYYEFSDPSASSERIRTENDENKQQDSADDEHVTFSYDSEDEKNTGPIGSFVKAISDMMHMISEWLMSVLNFI